MLSQLQRTIAEQSLLRSGDRVLVAVSGGPDSLALLHGLGKLAGRLGIELVAATVDHGLRAESRAEAEQVARWCGELGMTCQVLAADVPAHRGAHVSLQDAARRARAAVLAEAAERLGACRVALGHTADDQAETILFRIVRGTGLRGLAGIPYRRGAIIRPLLDVRRSAVLRFLNRRRIPFIQDPSNQDPRFTRSRIRHAWLPFLAAENPRVIEALLALGAESRAGVRPSVVGQAGPRPGRAAAARIAALSARKAGTTWVCYQGGIAELTYGKIAWRAPAPAGRTPQGEPSPLPLPGEGRYQWAVDGTRWAIEIRLTRAGTGRAASAAQPSAGVCFDASCLMHGLRLRPWRRGDRMFPRGGRGHRKLQDLFVDAKVPRRLRPRLPVLVAGPTDGCGDEVILFVPGLRPSERYRPAPDAAAWLEVRVTGPGAHLSCPKADSETARVDDLALDDNTFSLGTGYDPRGTF